MYSNAFSMTHSSASEEKKTKIPQKNTHYLLTFDDIHNTSKQTPNLSRACYSNEQKKNQNLK